MKPKPSSNSKITSSFLTIFLITLLTVCIFWFLLGQENVLAAGAYSLNFDGTNDYVDMGAGSATLSLPSFTIEAWVKADVTSSTRGVIDKFSLSQAKGFSIYIQSGKLYFLTGSGGGSYDWLKDNTRSACSANTWYHVAAVYDGTTKYLYVNGSLAAKKTVAYSTSSVNLVVGVAYSSPKTYFFDGLIDEVRIWNTARTSDQINSYKDTELTGSESGLVGYWNLNEGTGTTTTDLSPSGNNGTLSPTYPSDSPAWSESSIMSTSYAPPDNITSTVLSSSQIKLDWDAKSGAIGYRIFRDGFWLKDFYAISGLLEPVCDSNSPTWSTTTALGAYSLYFDGTDDYVLNLDDADLDFSLDQDFTIETWIQNSSSSYNGGIISNFNLVAGAYKGYVINYSTNGKFGFVIGDGTNFTEIYSNSAYTDYNWHHIAAKYQNGTMYLYIDGVQQNQTATVDFSPNTVSNLVIGGEYDNASSYRFKGFIDDVRIWNVARTSGEINTYKDSELTGNETGLARYLRFNEGSGCYINSTPPLTGLTTLTETGLYPNSSYEYRISTIFNDADSARKSDAINLTTNSGSPNPVVSSSKSAYQKLMTEGDSITYGIGADSLSTAWPHKLKDYLDSRNGGSLTSSITNYGLSGSVSSNVLGRIANEVTTATPDLVTIDIGLNDLRRGDLRSKGTVSIDTYRSNLRQIIDAVSPGNSRSLLLGNIPFMTNWTYTGFDWAAGNEAKRAVWNKVVRDVANEKGVILIDVSTAMNASTSLLADGIHPNQAGHDLIGTTFGNKLILGSSLGIYLNATNTVYSDGYYSYSSYPTPGVNLVNNLSVTPSTSSVDVVVDTWNTTSTYYKKWTESATTSNITTNHTIGDLRANQYYQVKVGGTVLQTLQANASGTISFTYSGGYSTKTFEVEELPTAPTIGTPTALSSTAIRWNFTDNADNETGFRVYTNADAIATSSATANLTYLDETGLSENTQYTRYVKAYNSYGESASSSATSTYTSANTPTGLTTINTADQSITVSVDTFPNATSASSGYYFSQGSHNSGWIQTNSWQDTGLACGTNYTYSVKYRNGNGVETSAVSQTFRTPNCAGAVIITPQINQQTTPQETIIPTVSFDKPISQMSQEEIKAKITEITQDITQLQSQQPTQSTPNPISTIPTTFSFQTNFKQGKAGLSVKYLQIILNQDPDTQLAKAGVGSPGKETNYFGPLTEKAVIKFQEKYRDAVLKPWGFTEGTGIVGKTTKAKLNQLLGK